jgi:hypothetical protein
VSERGELPADLEISCGWRAAEVRWERRGPGRHATSGDVETEELSERERLPEEPVPGRRYTRAARRWRLSAWLR